MNSLQNLQSARPSSRVSASRFGSTSVRRSMRSSDSSASSVVQSTISRPPSAGAKSWRLPLARLSASISARSQSSSSPHPWGILRVCTMRRSGARQVLCSSRSRFCSRRSNVTPTFTSLFLPMAAMYSIPLILQPLASSRSPSTHHPSCEPKRSHKADKRGFSGASTLSLYPIPSTTRKMVKKSDGLSAKPARGQGQ